MNMHTVDKDIICFSYRVLGSLLVIVWFKRTGQLVEQTNFLTVLKETGGGGCLIWEKVIKTKEMTIKSQTFALNSHLVFSKKNKKKQHSLHNCANLCTFSMNTHYVQL